MTQQHKAYMYALAAVLFWATVPTAFKLSLKTFTPLQLVLLSSIVSCLVLFGVLVVQGKVSLVRGASAAELLRSAGVGLFSPCLYYWIVLEAYWNLPAQVAQPLNMTWPIALALLGIPLLKQRMSPKSFGAILISFAGVVVISVYSTDSGVGDDANTGLGIGLALGSAILWALYWIINMRDGRDPVVKLFLGFAFGSVFSFLAVVVFSELPLDVFSGLFAPKGGFESLVKLAGPVYLGMFEMGFTFAIWLRALKLSSTTARVSVFIYGCPFLSLVFVGSILEETIHPATVVALVLIVSGIVLQQRWSR